MQVEFRWVEFGGMNPIWVEFQWNPYISIMLGYFIKSVKVNIFWGQTLYLVYLLCQAISLQQLRPTLFTENKLYTKIMTL